MPSPFPLPSRPDGRGAPTAESCPPSGPSPADIRSRYRCSAERLRHHVDREGDRLAILHTLHLPHRRRRKRRHCRSVRAPPASASRIAIRVFPPVMVIIFRVEASSSISTAATARDTAAAGTASPRLRRQMLQQHYRPRRHLGLRSVLCLNPHKRPAYRLAAGHQQMEVLAFLQRGVGSLNRCVPIQHRLHHFRPLDISRHPRRGLQPIAQELARHIRRRHFLIVRRAASPLHGIAGQKLLMRLHPLRLHRPSGSAALCAPPAGAAISNAPPQIIHCKRFQTHQYPPHRPGSFFYGHVWCNIANPRRRAFKPSPSRPSPWSDVIR